MQIRLNQVGFYTYGPKSAVVVSPETWYFTIQSPDLKTTYYTGELLPQKRWTASGEYAKIADFSGFTRPGTYVVTVTGAGSSYPFTISNQVNYELSRGLIRAFYYQRASMALDYQYAGKWARAAGHPDTRVIVHRSAASDSSKPGARKEGASYSSPKGWYDAGDYGKYVVNAGITTYSLLLLYEQFSDFFDTLFLNIPESGGNLPDLLAEIKWELDWLLTMQDPADGGVYHKLTTLNFVGNVMPAFAGGTRYFIGKGAAATFDFVGVCAAASRIYRKYLPAFADSCLNAALYAWEWGKQYPDSAYRGNPPDVVTGAYSDGNITDELFWASCELFLATGDSSYYLPPRGYDVPEWPHVGMLGLYSLALTNRDSAAILYVVSKANDLRNTIRASAFRTSLINFYWGSNGVAANQGMVLLVAYLLTEDISYLEGAIHMLDYIMGKNGVGYSFVTGFGKRSPMNPHHRPSEGDNIKDPVPGFLVGGPNGQAIVADCNYNYSDTVAKKWVDMACSYSTNEVAINWNAPAAFLAGGLEAVFNTSAYNIDDLRNKYTPDTVAPRVSVISILNLSPDKATVLLQTGEPVIATIEYSTDSKMAASKKTVSAWGDSLQIKLGGLIPETDYFLRCFLSDKRGNVTIVMDSFTTLSSPLVKPEVYDHPGEVYTPGSNYQIRYTNFPGVQSKLIYAMGGFAEADTLAFSENNGVYAAQIPASKVTQNGILYSILLVKDGDTLQTPQRALSPDSLHIDASSFTFPKAYSLVSLPGVYKSQSALKLFGASFGDTASWRYFGYDKNSISYLPFDTLRSGFGGWLFHNEQKSFSHRAKALKPDTLFPIVLKQGWNCIGNPFTFPVYWDNTMVGIDGALLRMTDSVASVFVRRQFFTYRDTLSDTRNNGWYSSNRDLKSHAFNDTSMLNPWEACWVFAERDSVCLLFNPSALKGGSALAKKRDASTKHWFCSFSARSGEYYDNTALCGASEFAQNGYDAFDSPKPPVISSDLKIGFSRPEWAKYNGLYAADVVSFSKKSFRWVLKVYNVHVNQPVSLTWEKEGVLEGHLYLEDPKTGTSIDMNSTGSYTILMETREQERELYVNWTQTSNPNARQGIPATWSFTHNPMHGVNAPVHLQYTVPVSSIDGNLITIAVYDLHGKCVKKLFEGWRRPGCYSLSWDRTDSSGKPVARGMYVARLSSETFSGNIRMFFVR